MEGISDLTGFYKGVSNGCLVEVCCQHRDWLIEALEKNNDRQVIVSKHHLLFIEKELELRNLLKDEYTTEDMMEIYL